MLSEWKVPGVRKRTKMMLRTQANKCVDSRIVGRPWPLLGHLEEPLFEIRPVAAAPDLSQARGVVFTSSNAVAVASALNARRDLPCFCVGEVTAARAADAGWPARCG